MKSIFVWAFLITALLQPGVSDIYLHTPPGSNNRLSGEGAAVTNANRLFDSQVDGTAVFILMMLHDLKRFSFRLVNCHSLSTLMVNYPLTHNFRKAWPCLAALCPHWDEEVEWVSWPVCPSLCCHLIIITAKHDTDGTLSPVFRSSDANIPYNRLQAKPAMPSGHLKMM